MSFGSFLCGRNDGYGENLLERTTYALNSMITQLDEVVFVDWATEQGKPTVIEAIEKDLIHNGNLKWVVVSEDLAREFTPNDPEAQVVCEVLARNIGLRRLSTDYRVSTNLDVVIPFREHYAKFLDERTMFTAGKRNIQLDLMSKLGPSTRPDLYMPLLKGLESKYGQQPEVQILPGDKYSLVSGCGDFQIAHKDLWFTIRGFEERLYKRGCADTNVQRKAVVFGYNIEVDWSIPVWHIEHGGGMGGRGGKNDPFLAVFMEETLNKEDWGFSNYPLEVNTL